MIATRFCALALSVSALLAPHADAEPFEFQNGDRVIFMGNTFAERLRHYNDFETMLAARHHELNLTFRNLAWSADEITLRPRPLDFGDIHTHLANQKADVIFLCYGANESFAGDAGLAQFRKDLGEFLRSILARRYNGETSPRLVLVSPIPQEATEAMPNVLARNLDIAAYAAAMRQVAEAYDVYYLDLYGPLTELGQAGLTDSLTINGVHLNAYGSWAVAHLMMQGLGYDDVQPEVRIDFATQKTQAAGALIRNYADDRSSLKLEVGWAPAVQPPMPAENVAPRALQTKHPVMRIGNLDPGTYELVSGGAVIAKASAGDWAKGITIHQSVPHPTTVALDALIREKNQLFFDRYRAINGYYIYGGRKEPFGVVSFPPEMDAFDALVAEHDTKIHKLAEAPIWTAYELKPVGE